MPAGPVASLQLLAVPAALDLDTVPGVDGFAVRLYAIGRDRPRPTPVRTGVIEILLFDGVVSYEQLPQHSPVRTWSFPADTLGRHVSETSFGLSYNFTLVWGQNQPTEKRITVVARYTDDDGRTVFSAPSTISVSSY